MTNTISDQQLTRTVAAKLLSIQAIKLNLKQPFTWSSGWKSPIYCDNRLALSYPEIRTFIRDLLSAEIRRSYPDAASIAGVATAGIPQGVLVADQLNLPFLYVRSKPKGHGMENMIEGKITPNQKVVIIEDLISTGGSALKAADALQSSGFNILGMMAIFTYGFERASKSFESADIPLICLSAYGTLIEEALEQGIVSASELTTLQNWRLDPENWDV